MKLRDLSSSWQQLENDFDSKSKPLGISFEKNGYLIAWVNESGIGSGTSFVWLTQSTFSGKEELEFRQSVLMKGALGQPCGN